MKIPNAPKVLLFLLIAALPQFTPAADKNPQSRPVLGDFAAEIRRPNGHIDTPATLDALKAAGANTYFYLIWHAASDWDDLPAFADAAAKQNIDVWVYLIPWSETPLVKKSWGYSEPYRTDYVRWAAEIAKLSIAHPNIVGYVIDDFYTNSTQPDRFAVPYVRQMVAAARDINPKIKFYPLVYFQQPWADFVDRFGPLVDGVVAAYPKSRTQVQNALLYLNDRPSGASLLIELPRNTPSRAGDKAAIAADFKVLDPANATLSFYFDADDQTDNHDYHIAFAKVNGRTVWESDTAGGAGGHAVELNLSQILAKGDTAKIELGLYENRGVSRYPVTLHLDDIRVTGFDTPSEFTTDRTWSRKPANPFALSVAPTAKHTGRFKLPMILMPAGEKEQHEKRYPEPGSPNNIANKVEMSLNLLRETRVAGVVTYCLPKAPDDPIYQAVKFEYRRAADALDRAPQK